MTTRTEAQRLKETYRLALAGGDVAYYREGFRRGDTIRFLIDEDEGFSDGLTVEYRETLAGQFRLHYGRTGSPFEQSKYYVMAGRLDTSTDAADWVPVDGPWKCGEGPFDAKP